MGFDAGDMTHFYVHPDALTYDLIDLESSSNVGVTGRWMYRIDTVNITGTFVIKIMCLIYQMNSLTISF